jgi:hypothetical protein
MSRSQQHRFHGDPERFSILADFINDRFGRDIQYVADVAGGRGMLSRILSKRFNYESEVVDPRGYALKGVETRQSEFDSSFADYYDLIVGLHPDEETRCVAEGALVRPAIMIPCCNFWAEEKLGSKELVSSIESYYEDHGVNYERVVLPFKGPKNVAIVSTP